MRHSAFAAFCTTICLLMTQATLKAQNYLYGTGQQTWGVNIPIENGFINVANGEVHLEISLSDAAQRGNLPANERLIYDSRIWQIVLNGSSYDFEPTNVPVSYSGFNPVCTGTPQTACTGGSGSVSFTNLSVPNSMAGWRFVSGAETGIAQGYLSFDANNLQEWSEWNWGWTDPSGTTHMFNATTGTAWCPSCGPTSASGYAMDGSGYYITVSNYSTPTVFDANGNEVYPAIIDRNGNTITTDSNGNLIDTIGRTPVKVTTSGTHIYYDVLTIGGVTKRYTVTTETINVHTNFSQSGTNEYSNTLTAIQSIALPDGSQYVFGYDSGTTAGNYGELESITLPTGGTIDFTYQNYLDSYQNENRWLATYAGGHGSYTFTPSVVTQCSGPNDVGCKEQVTVQDGQDNSVVYSLTLNNGAWNTSIANSASTTATTYNFSNSAPSWFGAGSMWVTASNTTTTLAGTGQIAQAQYAYSYPWAGKPSKVQLWDYYTGTQPTLPTKETDYSYGKIVNGAYFLTQQNQLDSTGTQIGQTIYNYDQSTPTTATGATGLVTAPGGSVRGNLTQIISGYGTTITTSSTYDTAGQKLSDIDGNTNQTTYVYSCSDAYLSDVILPVSFNGASLETGSVFDCPSGLMTQSKDVNGFVNNLSTQYSYYTSGSELGKPYTETAPDGGTTTYSYPSFTETDKVSSQSATASLTTKYILDSYGRLYQNVIVAPEGNITSETTYDGDGRPICNTTLHLATTSATDGTTCTYLDVLGRPDEQKFPDGTTSIIGYSGNVATTIDELTHTRTLTYDAFGRITKVMEPNASGILAYETDYQYNAFDEMIKIDQWGGASGSTSPGDRQRVFAYDSLGRKIAESIPENQSLTITAARTCTGTTAGTKWTKCFSYDNDGNILSTTDNAGNVVQATYDAINRKKSESYTGGSYQWAYDGNGISGSPLSPAVANAVGRLSNASNGSSAAQIYSYDAVGRVTKETYCIPLSCNSSILVSAGYDYFGNLTTLTYPDGRVMTNAFDPVGRVTGMTYSKWGTTNVGSAYYAASAFFPPGQTKTASMGNGITASIGYNSRQSLVSASYANSSGTTIWGRTFAWDKNATNLLLATDAITGYGRKYTYDTLNRLTNANDEDVHVSGATHSAGTVTINGSDKSAYIDCTSKAKSSCTLVWDTGTVSVKVNGVVVGSGGYGDGTATSDIASQIATSINSNPENLVTATASGSVVTLTSVIEGTQADYSLSTSVAWDSSDFSAASFTATTSGSAMTGGGGSSPSPDLSEIYTYDPFGNLTQSGSFSFSQSFNQFNQISGYSYDADGNQNTDIFSHSLTFNPLNELSSVASGGETYVYDSDGNRVEVHGSAVTDYIYFNGKMLASLSAGSYTDFIYAEDSLLAEVAGTQAAAPVYRIIDNVNSLVGNPNASGMTNSVIYAPFGQLISGTLAEPYGFASLQWDATTALNHATFRQYSPQQGRWQSPDPSNGSYDLTDPQSLNRYAYVNGRPLLFVDPTGQDPGGAACAGGPVACVIGIVGGLIIDDFLVDLLNRTNFHGSLKPRPSTNPWDDKFGLPNPGLGPAISQAIGIPSAGCEFGACGAEPNSLMPGAVTAPAGWCVEHPTVCALPAEFTAFFSRAVPVVATSAALLSLKGDAHPTPPGRADQCWDQYQHDLDVCRSNHKRSCYAQAAERYAACMAGKSLPPFNF